MYPSDKFYTHFARAYTRYAATKQAYLSAVNNFIKAGTGAAETLVDVGSGSGERAKIIADFLNIRHFTCIDNSQGMIDLARNIPGACVIKADISSAEFKPETKYDIVLCLWNVLGHIASKERETALKNIVGMVKDNGIIFIDVNNRYNIANYGAKSVIKNIFKDIFIHKKSNGDFNLQIEIDGAPINTIVHLFSPLEMKQLIKSAGLSVAKRELIDYKTGEIKSKLWQGQLVYELKKI